MLGPHVHPQFLIACALVAHGWQCVCLSFGDKMCIVHPVALGNKVLLDHDDEGNYNEGNDNEKDERMETMMKK